MKIFLLLTALLMLSGCAAINPFAPPTPIIACQAGTNYDPALCQAIQEQRAAAEQAEFERMRKSGPVYQQMCRDSWIHC